MARTILFASAEPKISTTFRAFLGTEYALESSALGKNVLERLRSKDVDILLLDHDLADMNGITLLRFLRETPFGVQLPVIYLSPRKTPESLAETFELGVDDYLVKPCDPREILLRVNVALRRRGERVTPWSPDIASGEIKLEPSQRRCTVYGKEIYLRPLEFALLELLMKKEGRVLTRPYLLTTLWGVDAEVETRVVDASISRLRRCLGRRGAKMIQTVSKMGYCFRSGDA